MGPGRRMKKQGMPPALEEFHGSQKKRKIGDVAKTNAAPAKKPRRSNDAGSTPAPAKATSVKIIPKKTTKGSGSTNIVNGNAKPTPVVLPTDDDSLEEDDFDDDDEVLGDEFENLDSANASSEDGVGLEELDEDELDGVESDDDSAFDSEEEQYPNGQFSEDEDYSDAEEKLTAANIEGLSRKLDIQQAEADAEAQQEMEDAAMQTNIAGDKTDIFDGADQSTTGLAPDMQMLRNRITETLRILGDFSKLADPEKSRADYTSLLLSDICTYYGYTPYLAEKLFSLFTPMEAFAFFEANETPRPVVIRTNTLRTNRRSLAQALINRGVVLEPVGKWSKVGLQIFESAVPLGATPEYLAGHYILQAASSFLPVMALAPQDNERVLDMAAAPGGKTTYISALMRNTGCVIANDPNRQRAKGLIGNIHRLGCKNVIVSNLDAKEFPKAMGGFDRVLLDAPCSGTGVIGKDPSVKTSKSERDFLALPHLQKQLLIAAIDSVNHASKTGGYVVYSTCSVTVEENEGVVQYALRKRPNVKIVDTGFGTFGSEGFKKYMNKRFDDKMTMTRRYFPHRENVDGFFVCKLKKTGPSPAAAGVNGTGAGKVNGTGKSKSAARAKSTDDNDEDESTHAVVNKAPITDDLPITDADDEFGGFDEVEDEKIIARSEKNWLRKRGLNPKLANGKKETGKENEGGINK